MMDKASEVEDECKSIRCETIKAVDRMIEIGVVDFGEQPDFNILTNWGTTFEKYCYVQKGVRKSVSETNNWISTYLVRKLNRFSSH